MSESLDDVVDWLRSAGPCRGLSREDCALIAASGNMQTGWEGADLMREGDPGDAMIILLEGEVMILKDDDAGHVRELARVGRGTLLGEIALLDRVPRSATVRAVGPVRYFEIERSAFEGLLAACAPAAVIMMTALARALARRQRLTDERLVRLLVDLGQRGIEPAAFDPFLHDLVIEVE